MPYGDDTSSSGNVTHLNFNVLENLQCYEQSSPRLPNARNNLLFYYINVTNKLKNNVYTYFYVFNYHHCLMY